MATQFCRECHQRLPAAEVIDTVRLTPFKAKLFRFVERQPGYTSTELGRHFYGSNAKGDPARAIRSHIFQINDLLLDVGARIQGGQITGYHVVRSST